ncbi:MAG TPA: DUF6326 family protein [Frateuria sp.]|uniref:DUF6326 family protein n=1 Tax=Frateuria sp. TaxID=2211372 RepID=UPI002D7E8A27|nr:DUF6326 family protein [Frateuria sp.]HET6806768.1 DUF6326 family protein [Frateuria sp.]
MAATPLEDAGIPVRLKLSALWTSVMFCYLYGDYFGLYQPGKLQGMLDGRMDPLGPTTQAVLVGTSLLMAVPGLMVFLSLVLAPAWCRWANILLGLSYTLIMAVSMPGAWWFYLALGVIEMLLTLAIVGYAWRWPRRGVP